MAKNNYKGGESLPLARTRELPGVSSIVTGGNHSIFYGMFYSSGSIKCNNAIDYTNMLKHFNLTEKYFIDLKGKKYKKSVFMEIHPELETMFLLGKKLIEINES